MKRYIKYLIIAALMISPIVINSCSDDEFSDKYADPSTIAKSALTCDKMMTKMLLMTHGTFVPGGFGWENSYIGKFAQVFGFPNNSGYGWDGNDSDNHFWGGFYEMLANYRTQEDVYSGLSEADKKDNDVFMWISQLMVYHQLAILVACWGDVPYAEAGKLLVNGDLYASQPHYQTQAELYTLMLNDLKSIANNLASAELSTNASAKIAKQDFMLKGDLSKWQMFANSLRLRIGLRLSNASDASLKSAGEQAVKDVLASATSVPTSLDNMLVYYQQPNDLSFTEIGANDVNRAQGFAAHAHISRMVDTNDPRLEVTYDRDATTQEWKGMDPQKPFNAESDGEREAIRSHYSSVDSNSFRTQNTKFPAIMFTDAEMWFIKAEAYSKSIVSGNATEAFRNGVMQSVKFYYDIQSGGTYKTPIPYPGDDVVNTFIDALLANTGGGANWYANLDEAIAVQKWLHLGFLQETESYIELRRTGMPRLYYRQDPNSVSIPWIPDRLRYPGTERQFNPFCPTEDKDSYYTPLVFAKSDWYNKIND